MIAKNICKNIAFIWAQLSIPGTSEKYTSISERLSAKKVESWKKVKSGSRVNISTSSIVFTFVQITFVKIMNQYVLCSRYGLNSKVD